MVLKSISGTAMNEESISFLKQFVNDQLEIIKEYMRKYSRKLQIIDSLSKEWNPEDIQRLREQMEEIIRIDISEKDIVTLEEKNIYQTAGDLIKILEKEANNQKKIIGTKIYNDLASLARKIKIFEKNLSLQHKWFMENTTEESQKKNKGQLITLIRREAGVLFDIDSTDLKDLTEKVNELLRIHKLNIVQENTYNVCESELHREIQQFDNDRLDFSIEKTTKLGGGFKNPVLLVKTSKDCEYVAKAFTEEGSFKESMNARKFIKAAGGLVPGIVRISDNEIVCEKIGGAPIRKILTSKSPESGRAFFILGKSLAMIHKNTLNEMSLYDPRTIFRRGYTKDYVRLKEHMKIILNMELISSETYNNFLKMRQAYTPTNLAAIIHGDAHLDNFFYVMNPETIIIVDYDDAHVGDPIADIGRVIASIRNWQYKSKLEERYVEEVINAFFQGYKSVLNIELRGTNLYMMRLYLIIIKSSKQLIDKVKNLIKNDSKFRDEYSTSMMQFFGRQFGNTKSISSYFYKEEIERLLEVQFCLSQIKNFVAGKDIIFNEKVLSEAA